MINCIYYEDNLTHSNTNTLVLNPPRMKVLKSDIQVNTDKVSKQSLLREKKFNDNQCKAVND